MTELKCMPRPGSSPAGKPRVYLCIHPDERELYRKTLADMILKIANCAVYYHEGDRYLEPHEMKPMSLVVAAITRRFLEEPTGTLEELRMARGEKVAVLPLILEPGAEALFNRRFEALHCLTPGEHTQPGEISFDQKLRQFLSAVLVKDELLPLVQDAFRKKIFLSYRKKDREWVETIQKRLHAHPDLWDVSMWYDEYLVPGENFNQEISAALERSDLFLLLVTDHLMEKGNYVLNCEYPMARKMGEARLPVVSVEAAPTDLKAFREVYKPIREVVPPEAVADAVLEALGVEKSSGSDLERAHLIAIAYLLGMGVLRDPERGLALLKDASRRGSPEATEQLASIYQFGAFAERDPEEECACRRRLVEQLEARRDTGTDLWLAQAAVDLAEAWWRRDKRDDAGKLFEKALKICREAPEDRDILLLQLVCLGRLGDSTDPEQAGVWYSQRLELSRRMVGLWNNPNDRGELAMSMARMAEVWAYRGGYDRALELLDESIGVFRELAVDNPDPTPRRELAVTLGRKADILKRRDIHAAVALQEEGEQILDALAAEFRLDRFRLDLAITCERLEDLWEQIGKEDRAEHYRGKSLRIRRELAPKLGTPAARSNLAGSLHRSGRHLLGTDHPERAEPLLLESIEIQERLLEETGRRFYAIRLIDCYITLADCYGRIEKPELQLRWLDRCGRELEQLLKEGSEDLAGQQILYCDRRGALAPDRGQELSWYRQGIRAGEQANLHTADGEFLLRFAGVHKNVGVLSGEREHFLAAMAILEHTEHMEGLLLLSGCAEALWEMEEWSGPDEKQMVCLRAVEVTEELERKQPGLWQEALREWQYRAAVACEENGGTGMALELYGASIQNNPNLGDVAEGHEKIANILERQGDLEGALEHWALCYEQDLVLLDRGAPNALGGMLATLNNLISLSRRAGRYEQAAGWGETFQKTLQNHLEGMGYEYPDEVPGMEDVFSMVTVILSDEGRRCAAEQQLEAAHRLLTASYKLFMKLTEDELLVSAVQNMMLQVDMALSRQAYALACDWAKRIPELLPCTEGLNDFRIGVARFLRESGAACAKAGEKAWALELCREAARICLELMEEDCSEDVVDDYSIICMEALHLTGCADLVKEALEVLGKLREQQPGLRWLETDYVCLSMVLKSWSE